jgi:hypothetical protein
MAAPAPLPDDALVVHGGANLPVSFAEGTDVTLDENGKLLNVSVNAGAGLTVEQLTAGDPSTGYCGIPHSRVGVTTVGAVRAAGGDVIWKPSPTNAKHCVLSGITPEQASDLFQPTLPNPNRPRRPRRRKK